MMLSFPRQSTAPKTIFSAAIGFTSLSLRCYSGASFGKAPASSAAAALLVNHGLSYPTPVNLSYFWNFGSLSALCLGLQLVSGIFLAMHYTAALSLAFDSVEHIMRDVAGGWFIRYLHANGASAFFGVVYLHMFRGLLYQSYRHPNRGVWLSGVALFVLMMATAFIGYVLPWGQMSFWGATVITNLFSVIPLVGPSLVQWLWGGFAVGGATLSRFYSLHYLLPFLLVALALLHIFALHQQGSSNPLGGESREVATFSLPLYPYFLVKDLLGALLLAALLGGFIFYAPNLLGHSDNYIEANSLVTPEHIVPEWYFLPFYAILRSIPNKTLGILAMGGALLLLALLPLEGALRRWGGLHPDQWVNFGENPLSHRSSQRRHMLLVNLLGAVFLLLGFVGSRPVAEPYVSAGLALTLAYFLLLLLLPLGGLRLWRSGGPTVARRTTSTNPTTTSAAATGAVAGRR